MKAVTATLLTVTALAAMSLPAFAQDEETAAPVTRITNADFCALVSQDPVACEGILTGMTTARVLPEAFAAVYDAGSDEGDLGPGPTDTNAPGAADQPSAGRG